MAMPARLSNQRRQTPNQFERREHQADAAAGTRLDALVDQVFGVDFRPALQREGRASSIPQQPFQARAVGAFDAHAGIDREAVTVAAGSYSNCLKTEDFTPIEPGQGEIKYYAPGIGNVLTISPDTGKRVELISVTRD